MSNYGSINHSFNQVATQPYGYQFTSNNLPNYTHSLRDSSHCFSSLNTLYPPSTARDSTQFAPHGIQPFYLKMLTKQMRVCAGCRLGFNNEVCVPDPPYIVCIAHEEPFVVSPKTSKNSCSLSC